MSQTISEANVQSTVANTDTEAANEALDDAVIEEGDEHRMDRYQVFLWLA